MIFSEKITLFSPNPFFLLLSELSLKFKGEPHQLKVFLKTLRGGQVADTRTESAQRANSVKTYLPDAVTYEPLVGFVCFSGFRKFMITMT